MLTIRFTTYNQLFLSNDQVAADSLQLVTKFQIPNSNSTIKHLPD
jgi:hypothetical protein